jgi:hypothetical protein
MNYLSSKVLFSSFLATNKAQVKKFKRVMNPVSPTEYGTVSVSPTTLRLQLTTQLEYGDTIYISTPDGKHKVTFE